MDQSKPRNLMAERASPDPESALIAQTRRNVWSLSQALLFLYVLMIFTISGDVQLTVIENLVGYSLFLVVCYESVKKGRIDFAIPGAFKLGIAFGAWALFLLCLEALFGDEFLAVEKLTRYQTLVRVIVLGLIVYNVSARHNSLLPLESALFLGVIFNLGMFLTGAASITLEGRGGGGLGQANSLAFALSMASMVALAKLYRLSLLSGTAVKGGLWSLLWLIAIQCICVYLNFAWTGSRTGIILSSLMLGFTIIALSVSLKRGQPKVLLLLVPLVAGILVALPRVSETPFFDRLANLIAFSQGTQFQTGEGSIVDRVAMADKAIDLWLERPLTGWGFDSFQYVSGFGGYSHNNYAELLATLGLVGFGLYMAIYVALFLQARRMKILGSMAPGTNVLCYLLLLLLLLPGFTTVTYYNKIQWICFGLLGSLPMLTYRPEHGNSPLGE